MSDIEQPVVDFFLAVQRRVNDADSGAVAQAFGSGRLSQLQRAGFADAKALQIDPTPITKWTALTRVLWSIWFKPDGQPDFVLEFVYHYVLTLDDPIVILATIEGDDTPETWSQLRTAVTN